MLEHELKPIFFQTTYEKKLYPETFLLRNNITESKRQGLQYNSNKNGGREKVRETKQEQMLLTQFFRMVSAMDRPARLRFRHCSRPRDLRRLRC